ncbi:MAG: hypothetical protein ACRBCT_09735 [Alphaproteobacteria bacterium]
MSEKNEFNSDALSLLNLAFKLHIDRLQESYERAKQGLIADFTRDNPNEDWVNHRAEILSEIKAQNPYEGVKIPDLMPILQEGTTGYVEGEGNNAVISRARYSAPQYRDHKREINNIISSARQTLNTQVGQTFSPGKMAALRETLSEQWGTRYNGGKFELILPFATGVEEYHETSNLKGIFGLAHDGRDFVLQGYTTELGQRPYILPEFRR